MKLLFLDIDGVANNHRFCKRSNSSTLSPRCVRQFNRIIEATQAKVVLSSAWRYIILGKAMSTQGFTYLLRTHGVIANVEVIGITKSDEECHRCGGIIFCGKLCPKCGVPTTRGDQIGRYMAGFFPHPESYVVLDDLDLGISAAGHPFIQTDGNRGLTAADADMAIDVLKSGMPPEILGAKVRFGLEAQGHIPTVERMLAEQKTWEQIGAFIGWCPKTAEKWYRRHLERQVKEAVNANH